MDAQVKDEVIFESGAVVITTTLAKFGPTTYTINGIGSIYIGQKRNQTLIWVALIAAAVAAFSYAQPYNNDRSLAAVGVVVAVIALISYFARRQLLMLSISSGDKEAYASGNYAALQEIKEAIELAVTRRG
jgi:hypothetical protein